MDDAIGVLQRAQFDDFTRLCEPNGFVEHLRKYRLLYSQHNRVLVVREAMARRHTGLGIQTAFMLKWLLLGMALNRPVYFQYCGSSKEPWAEPETRGGPRGPVLCQGLHYDLGHFFDLLGEHVESPGVSMRWTRRQIRTMRARGLNQTVVSSCTTNAQRVGSDLHLFLCDASPSGCKSITNPKGRLPPAVKEATHDFWLHQEASHPWLVYEYRSAGCEGFRWDTPARIYGSRLVAKGGGSELDQLLRAIPPVAPEWLERWPECAQFALLHPTPTVQTVLRSTIPVGTRRLVGIHLRTLAVDDSRCFGRPNASSLDESFATPSIAPGFGCRRLASCRKWRIEPAMAYGGLQRFVACIAALGQTVVAFSDSYLLDGMLRREFPGLVAFPKDADQMRQPTWHTLEPRLPLGPEQRQGRRRDDRLAARLAATADARLRSWRITAAEFYAMGLATAVYRLSESMFSELAVQRPVRHPRILGDARWLCQSSMDQDPADEFCSARPPLSDRAAAALQRRSCREHVRAYGVRLPHCGKV